MRCNMLPVVVVDSVVTGSVAVFIDIKNIEHVYLMPGHSFLPCDSAFGNIERKTIRESNIYDFDSYCNIIQNATTSQYQVVRMCQQDFLDYDISVLKQCVVNRKPVIESISFTEINVLYSNFYHHRLFDISCFIKIVFVLLKESKIFASLV